MDSGHINPQFDFAIKKMDSVLSKMEDAVLAQMVETIRLFSNMTVEGAKLIRKEDAALNELAVQVEEEALLVLAKHQPVAEDLRHTVAALKMSIEYERAADYIKNLVKSIGRLAAHDDDNLLILPSLANMLKEVQNMFEQFQQARRSGDVDLAVRVWLKDQKIDDLCSEAVREAFYNQQGGEGSVHSLIHSVFIAKNTERIGDKIKNLVEIFYYQKTGLQLDIKTD